MQNETYLVFIIRGYDRFDVERDVMYDVFEFQIIAKSEKEALEKAKKLKKCKGYRVDKVIEQMKK